MHTKRMLVMLLFLGLGVTLTSIYAGEDDRVARMLQAPSGVFDIESENGRLLRLKVKADADVPTSMRASQADRYARQKANREARAALTKYLKDQVVFSESSNGGVTLEIKNSQESSETLEVSARLFNSTASAVLNGLTTLVDSIEGEGDGRTCVVVLGWSQKSSSLAGQAKATMEANANPPPSTSRNAGSGSITSSQTPKGNTDTVTRVGNLDDF